jgi:hypothetical protein
MRVGGYLLVAGDPHDQHDGTARQTARLDWCSWQVIGGFDSRHVIERLQGLRRRVRDKRGAIITSRVVSATPFSTWPRKVVRVRTFSPATLGNNYSHAPLGRYQRRTLSLFVS